MSLCVIFRGAVDRLFENILIDYSIIRVHHCGTYFKKCCIVKYIICGHTCLLYYNSNLEYSTVLIIWPKGCVYVWVCARMCPHACWWYTAILSRRLREDWVNVSLVRYHHLGWSDLMLDGISISSDQIFKRHALTGLLNIYLVIIKFRHYRQQRIHKTKTKKGKSIRKISRHFIYFILLGCVL